MKCTGSRKSISKLYPLSLLPGLKGIFKNFLNDLWQLYFLAKGTQNWFKIVKSQIMEQEIGGLMMARRDIDAIMRSRHDIGIASLFDVDALRMGFGAKRHLVFESKLKRTLANISKVSIVIHIDIY